MEQYKTYLFMNDQLHKEMFKAKLCATAFGNTGRYKGTARL